MSFLPAPIDAKQSIITPRTCHSRFSRGSTTTWPTLQPNEPSYHRFKNRRVPATYYSDSGTNLVGAKSEFEDCLLKIDQQNIASLSLQRVKKIILPTWRTSLGWRVGKPGKIFKESCGSRQISVGVSLKHLRQHSGGVWWQNFVLRCKSGRIGVWDILSSWRNRPLGRILNTFEVTDIVVVSVIGKIYHPRSFAPHPRNTRWTRNVCAELTQGLRYSWRNIFFGALSNFRRY